MRPEGVFHHFEEGGTRLALIVHRGRKWMKVIPARLAEDGPGIRVVKLKCEEERHSTPLEEGGTEKVLKLLRGWARKWGATKEARGFLFPRR